MIPDIRNEWWLAKKIYGDKLCTIFDGVSDVEQRKNRVRRAIIGGKLQNAKVSKKTTFTDAFERLYGERL